MKFLKELSKEKKYCQDKCEFILKVLLVNDPAIEYDDVIESDNVQANCSQIDDVLSDMVLRYMSDS
jgi:hypothetical protein